jgi:hypothetical protein
MEWERFGEVNRKCQKANPRTKSQLEIFNSNLFLEL